MTLMPPMTHFTPHDLTQAASTGTAAPTSRPTHRAHRGWHLAAALTLTCLALGACNPAAAQTSGSAAVSPSLEASTADARERFTPRPDLQSRFDALGTRGTLVLMDSTSRQWIASDAARAYTPYLPASTFKIPMSLIALETGVAKDAQQRFPWDGKKRRLDDWNQDQTLASAYKVSAVWVFQHLARTVGQPTVQQFLYNFRYGNAIAGPVGDTFWLEGDLRISAVGQIDFLRRLHDRVLPLSDRTYDIAHEVMRRDRGPGWTLYAKTGWAATDKISLGWFVGWLERDRDPRPVYFALNMDMVRDDLGPKRELIVKDTLRALGYLD